MSTIFRDSKRWHLKNYESDELFLYSRHACSASSMVSIVSGVDIAINSRDDPGVLNVIQLINERKQSQRTFHQHILHRSSPQQFFLGTTLMFRVRFSSYFSHLTSQLVCPRLKWLTVLAYLPVNRSQ